MSKNAIIAVLADSESELEFLREQFSIHMVSPVLANDPTHLLERICQTPCVGVVISVPRFLRMDAAEKRVIQSVEPFLPVARFRFNRASGAMAIMSHVTGTQASLGEFIAKCISLGPKRIRKSERFPRHLNVIISKKPDLSAPEESFTFNISKEGCFLYTGQKWTPGERIYLSVHDPFTGATIDETIEAEVVRRIPWGIPAHPQGVGVRFIDPSSRNALMMISRIAASSHAST
jgi:hypothetical protein